MTTRLGRKKLLNDANCARSSNIKVEKEFVPAKRRLVKVKEESAHTHSQNWKTKLEDLKVEKDSAEVKRKRVEVKEELDHAQYSWFPQNWKQQLDDIRQMRLKRDAPVDIVGCEKASSALKFTEQERRYHVLVSLMLSAMTKDQTTHAAVQRLIEYGLFPEKIMHTDEAVLEKLIYPVGFYKRKAVFLKQASAQLCEKFGGDIPKTVEDLCSLPGVGPKMAYLAMSSGWGQVVGIGVDVHVHRISNRIGWVRQPTKTPEKTRKELEDWLPKSYWKEVNWLLVGFGQQICTPQRPKCSQCLSKEICPFARNPKNFAKKSGQNKKQLKEEAAS